MADNQLRLLLIEEHEDDAQRIVDALHDFGYLAKTHHLSSLEQLPQALRAGTWDLLITAHQVAGQPYGEVAAMLQQHDSTLPLVVVGAATLQHDELAAAFKAGVSDILLKDNLSRLGGSVAVTLAHHQQQQLNLRSRQLITYLETLRERERAIIAREVHDDLGNTLMGLKLDVAWLRRHLSQGGAVDEKLATMGHQLETSIDVVRRIITDLRPSVLDDLGLTAAIEWKLSVFCERNALICQFDNHAEGVMLGGAEDAITVFRIFQEVLTNIRRHARAARVAVELSLDAHAGALLLVVRDDGVGICEEDLHKGDSFGILRMYERARRIGASLHIERGAAGGTVVSLTVPLLGHL